MIFGLKNKIKELVSNPMILKDAIKQVIKDMSEREEWIPLLQQIIREEPMIIKDILIVTKTIEKVCLNELKALQTRRQNQEEH